MPRDDNCGYHTLVDQLDSYAQDRLHLLSRVLMGQVAGFNYQLLKQLAIGQRAITLDIQRADAPALLPLYGLMRDGVWIEHPLIEAISRLFAVNIVQFNAMGHATRIGMVVCAHPKAPVLYMGYEGRHKDLGGVEHFASLAGDPQVPEDRESLHRLLKRNPFFERMPAPAIMMRRILQAYEKYQVLVQWYQARAAAVRSQPLKQGPRLSAPRGRACLGEPLLPGGEEYTECCSNCLVM
jgi:hypothetical protein